ncbi:MAG: Rieske (2Fe-2S) protein [Chloroflexi bacterium]|nr:MAG: Rieske (2Fe-2S) protein [Chloroflexota bacterium]
MSRTDRRLHRYIDALLKERKPRPGEAGDDLRAMQLAARLHAAHPGSAEPSADFIDGLARRMRQGEDDSAAAVPMPQRRRFLAAAGLAAAAGVGAGFGIDRLAEGRTSPSGQQQPLLPTEAGWIPVARVADLQLGQIQRFSANGIEGFVLNVGGRISALSAVCTDQGCILKADTAGSRLNCPCHYATFNLDGTPRTGTYKYGLTPLPVIQVRMNGANVEALLPQTT